MLGEHKKAITHTLPNVKKNYDSFDSAVYWHPAILIYKARLGLTFLPDSPTTY